MLKTRIITATILLAVLLPILFWLPSIYVAVFFLLALLAAAWEWSRLLYPQVGRAAWFYAAFCLVIILFLLAMQNIAWQFALLLLAVIFWFFLAPFILAKGMRFLCSARSYFIACNLVCFSLFARTRASIFTQYDGFSLDC